MEKNFKHFRQFGIVFIPVSLVGWIILILGLVYAVYTFIKIDSTSHSVSDTLRPFFFNLVIIAVVYSLIAFLMTRNNKK
jgi:hypothetical protein